MDTIDRLSDRIELAEEQGALLPLIAREALEEALEHKPFAGRDEDWLHQRRATFVTLTHRPTARGARSPEEEGRLRGCIGTIRATRTLLEDVRTNTWAAALRDPRFPPLTAEELETEPVVISVSVLSPLSPLSPVAPLEAPSEAELLRALEPGVHGVVLEWGTLCGTYLPQVWRHFPDPADFVRSLKAKAGLHPDFWAPDLGIWTFTVRSWSEAD